MTEKPDRDRRFASTLAKGLRIMQVFKPSDQSLGNRELARRTGMPPSTVSRLTFTLASLGFLEQLHPSETYRLGPSVMALGYTARAGLSFLPMAEITMQQLADDTGVLVALTMRDQNAVMFTRCWRPRHAPSIWLSEGHRIPFEGTAPGRAIVAARNGNGDLTDAQKADRDRLEAVGFLSAFGAWNPEVNGCAVPFQSDAGTEPFAFICGAMAEVLNEKRIEEEVGPMLRDRVQTLRQSLGYQ
ncbi:IclR family transcriptional regulator [Roseibium sp. RKSG952]|uniref:IclR family transcriptional regulator n=1 Tax=Roseibium sp. RKSG952 TaxID=2529384 RepID=UPI0012BC6913|nr:helix-turn-helix domain-containing protein [Roseibium sp. RKSG952]MTI00427.1 IclR family transcriptional regulator [Roseibium sp. RKSG952]